MKESKKAPTKPQILTLWGEKLRISANKSKDLCSTETMTVLIALRPSVGLLTAKIKAIKMSQSFNIAVTLENINCHNVMRKSRNLKIKTRRL